MVRLGVGPLPSFSPSSHSTAAQLISEAQSVLHRAISLALDDGEALEAHALLGHLAYQQSRFNEAQRCYESVLAWDHDDELELDHDPLLLHRLGHIALSTGEWEKAKETFLQLASCLSSAGAWFGVALCCLALSGASSSSSSEEAYAALVQANLLDKSHSGVWARLSLLSLQRGRTQLGHQALMHALSLGCEEQEVLVSIAALFAQAGQLALAASTLERALSSSRHSVELRSLQKSRGKNVVDLEPQRGDR